MLVLVNVLFVYLQQIGIDVINICLK